MLRGWTYLQMFKFLQVVTNFNGAQYSPKSQDNRAMTAIYSLAILQVTEGVHWPATLSHFHGNSMKKY